jgi:hypothetical protein
MILWWSFVALMGGAGPAWGAQHAARSTPVEWVLIDGAKQPWLLPEWMVWENVFSGVYTIRNKGLEGSPLDSLAVTPSELKRLETAALWYSEQRDACVERQKKEVAMRRAAKRPPADVDNGQREVILECRRQVLDRADALLSIMSDEGRAALLAYVEARKAGMWARIAKSELEFYRLPR